MVSGKEPAAAAPASPWLGLVLVFGATALAAAIGSSASIRAASFYAELAKPAWAPPAQVFGPVWTALYFLMAVAAWLVWRRVGPVAARGPLLLYLAQLALNALWTWVFFRWRSGGWALAEILLLWLVLLFVILGFFRVRVVAGVLLLPYWAWVTFAAALTAAIWRLNPRVL